MGYCKVIENRNSGHTINDFERVTFKTNVTVVQIYKIERPRAEY